jgi:UDP:flavonoid glycosyltransferase YjiC (YdhE family)
MAALARRLLAEGVPLICIPLDNDQPGVAARVAAHQAGIVVPRRKLTVERLRPAIVAVLSEERYPAAARRLQIAILQIDRLEQASKIIELALKIGIPASTRSQLTRTSTAEFCGVVLN